MKRPKHTPQTLAALKARRFTGDETSVPESPFASTLTASDREKREMYERAERANSSRVAGAAAFRRGRDFQKEVRQSIESYNNDGRAAITEVNVKTVGPMNALVYSEPATVDFVGVAAEGIAIAFDAKVHSGRASIPVEHDYKNRQRQVRQLQFLRSFRRRGGVAFLLVHCDDLGITWAVQDFDWLLGDLGQSALAVPLRTLVRADRSGRAQRCISHHPVVRESSVADLSAGRPRWPFTESLDYEKRGPMYLMPTIEEIVAREF